MGVSEHRITKMLTKLKRMDLVTQISFNGRIRQLETAWSRVMTTSQTRQKRRGSLVKNDEAGPAKTTSRNRVNKSNRQGEVGGRFENAPSDLGLSTNGKAKKKQPELSGWDARAGQKLKEILVKYDTDIQRSRINTLAKQIRELRLKRKTSKRRIKDVLLWLEDHYDEKYTPKMHKASDIRTKFKQIEEAMARSEQDDMSDEERELLQEHFLDPKGLQQVIDYDRMREFDD